MTIDAIATVSTSSPETFDVTDPATGRVVGTVREADETDVGAAIDQAQAAAAHWRSVTALERGRLLRRAGDLLLERREDVARLITAEQGKPLAEAAGEVDYAASYFAWFAGEAERVYGRIAPGSRADHRAMILRQPVGITAAITPWNFPAAMLARKIGPAIAAGCSCIAKPAEATPLTALALARVFSDSGAPPGLLTVVTSSRPQMVAEVLLGDSRVRKLSFTGSTEVGRTLVRLSATNITRLSLELGGHAPFVVFADADVDRAVEHVMIAKFRNAGQTCICANRIYVQADIYDDFLERLAARVRDLRLGPGTEDGVDLGPLINADAVAKAARHVNDAVAQGAALLVGGSQLDGPGTFFEPTLLSGINTNMLIAREETFGPVAGVTTFGDEDEAVALANDTPYGLAAYVQTRDSARVWRMSERLDFGVIGINDGGPSNPAAPFGGMKASGYGREGGAEGIDDYLETKYVSIGGVA